MTRPAEEVSAAMAAIGVQELKVELHARDHVSGAAAKPQAAVAARSSGRPKAPSLERGMKRVGTLLAAAEELFGEVGFGAASMNEIARRAGASIGSLYQFFPTKLSLAFALSERYVDEIKTSWLAIDVDALDGDTLRFARGLIGVTLDCIGRQRAFATLDEAQAQLQYRPATRDELSYELAALIGRLAPQTLPQTRDKLGHMTLQMLKAAYALERSCPLDDLQPREEMAIVIASYLKHQLG